MSFQKVLDKYRKFSFSEQDKGERFERLMQAYLKTDPKYSNKFKKVWLWNEFPGRKDLGGSDTGIDLVALTHEGDYWAIQCKCYLETAVIDKPAVDSFLSTSSRQFLNEEFKTVRFAHRLWISTTNKWGGNATQAIQNQHPPVTRLNLFDLQESPVDWEKLEKGISGEASRTPKKTLRPHQKTALEKAHEYYKESDRGKLIMACGTGKTFAALRIAENETDNKGLILFLVPSISLLGQTLREWTADAIEPINAICICSDSEVSKKRNKNEDTDSFSVVDLALPASTDVKNILHQFEYIKKSQKKGMTVVFSTYQSIAVIAAAQDALLRENKNKYGVFDLVICDEAHRTTGVALTDEDSSSFIKVHDNKFIKAQKRLYMTATPRLYSDDAKGKAAQADAIICSMDDIDKYGDEIYRIGFGEAVERDLLTDYKVLVLTISDKDVPPAVQKMIMDKASEINTDDASKLIGCINALSKHIIGDKDNIKNSDPEPMRRAVAFCPRIVDSKKITSIFNSATEEYLSSLPEEARNEMVSVSAAHIDGTMTAPARDELLGWLKADTNNDECRVLTNVRCLSEGVDVPSLDAVMFLSARNSQVDVVQSVGRVMRKSPGKNYGYIIIPVIVPSDVDPNKALDDNERYKVVWTVLNALRAHDDRFNATVNKIELNKKRPQQILVGRPEYSFDDDGIPVIADPESEYITRKELSQQIAMQFEQLQNVVFAKMVQKVGDRRYWEQWAKNVAEIAERHVERISHLIKGEGEHAIAFGEFLKGLQRNINPAITAQEAVEMLSQHIITKPVFEALFEGYSFVKNNPISVSMQKMLDLLEAQAIEKDIETLDKFYESVRMRAEGIDNAEAKQKIIIELYDKFFKTAFPRMVERLGIVYTPVEVVDFIIHSVDDILKKEFGRNLSDENINIIDPFVGTGTFIVRLLQSGLIKKEDLARKYKQEIFANEIILLAYYIAAVNIENTFHDLNPEAEYESFEGICLTDTFQLGEADSSEKLFSEMFPQNSERVKNQKKSSIRVIIGNPPYSVGQKSANDNAQNQKYDLLERRIEETYIASVSVTQKKSLYDSYFKAFRWASDRIDKKKGGIIAFITNGNWLNSATGAGFRKSLKDEFSNVYVLNLRGNQNSSGEISKKEGGKIFGSGSRIPTAITILIKNSGILNNGKINYYDIGDYLSREDKLKKLKEWNGINNIKWEIIKPNQEGDWLNFGNNLFKEFISLSPEKKYAINSTSIFNTYSLGLSSNRAAWVYNYSKSRCFENMQITIDFYNSQLNEYNNLSGNSRNIPIKNFVTYNSKKISWTVGLMKSLKSNKKLSLNKSNLALSLYRPFQKQFLYFNRVFNEQPGQQNKFFPNFHCSNLVITTPGIGSIKDFYTLITNCIRDLDTYGGTQCFPLYYFEENKTLQKGLFDETMEDRYIQRDGISDFILDRARKQYGKAVTKEDIFYYVYGFLHSLDYRETFANDLKKVLPRIPLVDEPRDFWKFSKAGRALADLHINYETVPAYDRVKVTGAESGFYKVEKMRFPKKGQKDCIIYNSKITIENIPAKAYEYVVNGKSAIEWIMERYQVTTHKESGITNDPNDWAEEVDNPRYILDLLLSIINVSVQTVDIVNSLPKLSFETASKEKVSV
jgi:predicted helicase